MRNMMNMTGIYGIVAFIALLLMFGYQKLIKKKELCLSYIYFAVFTVNAGYFLLSISRTLKGALNANRLVYLASVFLPLAMLVTIMNICQITYKRKHLAVLIFAGIVVFGLAASGGYLDIYYKNVILEFRNGAAILLKEYGPFHSFYGMYLLSYFVAMIGFILYAMKKKKRVPYKIAVFVLVIVLGNLSTWLVEQFIAVEFEFLSISYVLTEGLLLVFYAIMEENSLQKVVYEQKSSVISEEQNNFEEELEKSDEEIDDELSADSSKKQNKREEVLSQVKQRMIAGKPEELERLSVREMEVLLLILDNKKRKSIAEELEVTENTVKKHTSHIFSKLGVTNRKELFEQCEKNIVQDKE